MTTQSTCPNCQQLLAELERLRAQLEEARKRIAALEAEVRRGRRSAAPFSRGEPIPGRRPGRGRFRYRSRPPEEAIRETVEVPLEACPECGGPLEDRATHEQVQVDIPEVRPVITRFRTESGYCRRCRKRVRSRHARPVSLATGAVGGEGVGGGPEASAGRLSEGGGAVPGGLGSGPGPGLWAAGGEGGAGLSGVGGGPSGLGGGARRYFYKFYKEVA
jgi:transposase